MLQTGCTFGHKENWFGSREFIPGSSRRSNGSLIQIGAEQQKEVRSWNDEVLIGQLPEYDRDRMRRRIRPRGATIASMPKAELGQRGSSGNT